MSRNQFFPSILIFLRFLALFVDNVIAQIFNISFTSIEKYLPMISNIFFTVTVKEKMPASVKRLKKYPYFLGKIENGIQWISKGYFLMVKGLFSFMVKIHHHSNLFFIKKVSIPNEFLRC